MTVKGVCSFQNNKEHSLPIPQNVTFVSLLPVAFPPQKDTLKTADKTCAATALLFILISSRTSTYRATTIPSAC